MAQILIVDDDAGFTTGLAEYLRLKDHRVSTANSVAAGRKLLTSRTPDVLLLDLMLPDGSGLELLDAFGNERPGKVVIMTGHSGVKSLIGGMVGDGITYLTKPVEPRELLGIVNAVPTADSDESEIGGAHFGLLIGESEAMHSVYGKLRQVAPTDSTVFVQGESGTGKELVAEAVHRLGNRSGAFVPVNCGGLSAELISSQLFGHEKGSFTGANKSHAGFFERASGGTLFLDEITEMPTEQQTHLLRALETGKILRLGAESETAVKTRLVVATNRDPARAVRDRVLREDLYYRLRVFPIDLPPLRDRKGDITLLAQHFLDERNRANGTDKSFSDEALEKMERHSWPGNVRELRHAVHRAYIMANDDVVQVQDSYDDVLTSDIEGVRAGRSIADVEKDLIMATLKKFDGDKSATAASLGISLKTLYNRLKAYEESQDL